ncbi:transcriptional repressor MprA [Pseudobythopirellula maris]|uniref:Transcriptional repressor MprA n=1 Tax=Pseudobythopirellula maris TaxID=2527991 RepID=A0A5C5ZIF7_9BACT|nr:MarR family transcriptional regulator [Pseudobythopirellula maris]TWT87144.1 transcriptional repressor MprA [Pseudobythopirellula maris]
MPNGRNETKRKQVASQATPGDAVADRILKAIRRVLRRTADHSRQLAKEAGLSATQLICLRLIGEAGAKDQITAAQLTETVQLSPATVSRILDRLDHLGLITRERATEDRRRVLLRVTPGGRSKIRKLPMPLQERFLTRLNALSDAERQNLLTSLETIVEMMGAEELDVAPVLAPVVDEKPLG